MREIVDTLSAEQYVAAQAAGDPGLIRSVLEETNWFGSNYATFAAAEEARLIAVDSVGPMRKEIREWEMQYAEPFGQRKGVFVENMGYYNGLNQWSDEERAAIADSGLTPLVSNTMKRYMDTMLGEFWAANKEWRASGDPNDEYADQKAEFMTHLLRSVAQQNEWDRIAHQLVRDAVIGGQCVGSAKNDPRDPSGFIRLDRHRPYEFMFDLESAENGSWKNCKYVWRGHYVRRTDLQWEYPLWAADIENFSPGQMMNQYPYLETWFNPKVNRKANELQTMTFDPMASRYASTVIFKREFYRRRTVTAYRVWDGHAERSHDFPLAEKDQANAWMRMLWQYYQQVGAASQNPQEPRVSIRLINKQVVDQEIWAGDSLIAINTSDVDRIPYKSCIPEYIDGEITSFFEQGKDMQRLRNRVMIFMDMLASGIQGKTIFNMFYAPQNMTERDVDDAWTRPTKMLKVNSADPDIMKKLVHHVPPPQYGPLTEQLFNFATGDTEQMFGGLSAIGVAESSSESGAAVRARQHASAIATIPLIKEWEYFLKEMGEDIVYLSQFMDPNVQLTYVDDEGNATNRSIASDGIQSIGEMRFKVQVVQTESSPTERDAQLSQLYNVLHNAPQYAGAAMPIILKKLDIDYSMRKEMLDNVAAADQFNQEMTARAQQLEEFKVKTQMELQIRDRELKAEELRIRELELYVPTTTLSGKLGEVPPALEAELLERQKFYADPKGIAVDRVANIQMQQAALDLEQTRRNELMTPDQRKIDAQKAKGPQPPKGSKDTAARRRKKK